ncbi:glycosyltransferase [Streptomyces gilvifuscus]|uniref:Glycosyltransferase n=1 Tax=Streptomyces gilvifuscus TaxID=1550617 RepID=A0ABT5G6T6_9ACTN|nr:glycosyltransferase [Streptomyces gilvifuscus]MDC2960391.1 glycosyltransferase [Streptomyces gilvifuscus]
MSLVVRFAPTVSVDEREDLLERLRQAGAPARLSPADLDHRALFEESRKLVKAIVRDTANHAVNQLDSVGYRDTGRVLRDWLRGLDDADPHNASAQIVTPKGRAVSVDGTVPDRAFEALADSARRPSAADRLAWDGAAWASMAPSGELLPVEAPQQLRVLAIADEWFSRRGGISTINRELSKALAKVSGVEVYCVILGSVSEQERSNAAEADVTLLEMPQTFGLRAGETLLRPPTLPGGAEPDLIIGHGRVSGPYAYALTKDVFQQACHFHFVHTEPDRLEWLKTEREDDPARRAEERSWAEWRLGGSAARAVGVGPVLYQMLERDLPRTAPPPLQLDPGFDVARTQPPEKLRGVPLVTLMGRLEDMDAKGVALAVKATNRALGLRPDLGRIDLMLRGSHEGDGAGLSEKTSRWATESKLHVLVRNYTTDREMLDHDLQRVWLALMPSRAEAFGLVGAEHIQAGVPCLISEDSGLGMLLTKVVPDLARGVVIPVTGDKKDTDIWAHHIAEMLAHPQEALVRALALRDAMAGQRRWADAARQLLDAANAARGGAA